MANLSKIQLKYCFLTMLTLTKHTCIKQTALCNLNFSSGQFNMPDILYVNTATDYLEVAANNCASAEDKCNLLRTQVQNYKA